MWKINKWKSCITLVIATLLVTIIILFALKWPQKIAVHKAMGYKQYAIVIISKKPFVSFFDTRELYADIWLDGNKTRYHLTKLYGLSEYNMKIKDITILPDEGVIKVEFIEPEYSRSKTGVDLYKIL